MIKICGKTEMAALATPTRLLDEYVTNLKVLGKVPSGGRLCVHDGDLHIEGTTFLAPIKRWLLSDGRSNTLAVLRHLIGNSLELAHGMAAGRGDRRTDALFDSLLSELRNALLGLKNLQTTYAGDRTTLASLDVLCEKIEINLRFLRTSDDEGTHPPPAPVLPEPPDVPAGSPDTSPVARWKRKKAERDREKNDAQCKAA